MGDEVKCYGLVINGFSDDRFLETVQKSVDVLEDMGCETFVASPEKPADADHYIPPKPGKIKKAIKELEGKIDDDDELVIYTTGHGGKKDSIGTLCLGAGWNCPKSITDMLDKIKYGQRTVIMVQCFSGNWNKVFLNDPKTLLSTAGSKDEAVCGDIFANYYWDNSITDLNDDGVISWQERYAYAVEHAILDGVNCSVPQLVPSPGYKQPGKPPFGTESKEVPDEFSLRGALKDLKPGQYAIVLFEYYNPYEDDGEIFEKQVIKAGGQHLWLRTTNEDLAKDYGLSETAVLAINADGDRFIVPDINSIEEGIAQFHVTPEQLIMKRLSAAEDIEDDKDRYRALCMVIDDIHKYGLETISPMLAKRFAHASTAIEDDDNAQYFIHNLISTFFKKMDLGDDAVTIVSDLIKAVEGIEDNFCRSSAIGIVASYISGIDLLENSVPLFESLIEATYDIENEGNRSFALTALADAVADAGIDEMSAPLFKALAQAAAKIENDHNCIMTLNSIIEALPTDVLGKEALSVFPKLVKAVSTIDANSSFGYYRVDALMKIVKNMQHMGFSENDEGVLSLYEYIVFVLEETKTCWGYGDVLTDIIEDIGDGGLTKNEIPLFGKLVHSVKKVDSEYSRISIYCLMASHYKKDGLEKDAAWVIGKAIHTARTIEDDFARSVALGYLAYKLVGAGYKEKSVKIFEDAIKEVENVASSLKKDEAIDKIGFYLEKAGFKGLTLQDLM